MAAHSPLRAASGPRAEMLLSQRNDAAKSPANNQRSYNSSQIEGDRGTMQGFKNLRFTLFALITLIWISSLTSLQAQTTSFTYQGRLSDGGLPANGVYDLQFKLFDAASGGAQQGGTVLRDDVSVTG